MEVPEAMQRPVARVLLFDSDERLLLLFDPHPEWGGYWYPPGGRIEEGEAPAEAARRELLEEVGIAAEIGALVLRCRARFTYRGRRLDQDEWHFLGRSGRPEAVTSRTGDNEAAAVAAHRWWSLQELQSSDERFFPDGLVEIVRQLSETGPPPQPWITSP
jgi:8-oxo-dGTP pyrophosphatase MutT (NUDIX family)